SSEIPLQFSLSQNYPNPFNPATKIKFAIPAGNASLTTITVYDIVGRQVAVLVNQQLRPGTYEVDWDASVYPSGVYFYTVSSVSFNETKKMVLLK
ncbi:MAG TPA: T9SS type A sorting domain-containing protein, partial [Ignavibacteria bacterium]|nr:T9SS type A sorting domain-containing protein [Ignavibacteria bacterium]